MSGTRVDLPHNTPWLITILADIATRSRTNLSKKRPSNQPGDLHAGITEPLTTDRCDLLDLLVTLRDT